jgi:hypothetical protein
MSVDYLLFLLLLQLTLSQVAHNTNGTASDRILNKALSKKLSEIMWSDDPDALVR